MSSGTWPKRWSGYSLNEEHAPNAGNQLQTRFSGDNTSSKKDLLAYQELAYSLGRHNLNRAV